MAAAKRGHTYIARHLAANVNVAELEAPCNQCVPKNMPDATRV